jgi:phosphotransferase system enzyme I (PtsI)
MTESTRGIGVSPGRSGTARWSRCAPRSARRTTSQPRPTRRRARPGQGRLRVGRHNAGGAGGNADETAQQILTATALIARDKGLQKAIGKHLAAGQGPTTAVTAAVEEYVAQFEALGGYFAERVTDLKDVRNRAVAAATRTRRPRGSGLSRPERHRRPRPRPGRDRDAQPGHGSGHRHRGGRAHQPHRHPRCPDGDPAVVQFAGATAIPAGTIVAVDGDSGEVTLDPSEDYQRELVGKRERRRSALAGSAGPGRTRDGHPVALLANIGGVDDAVSAAAQDLEGVGLFRTEFVFLSRRHRADARGADRDLHQGLRTVRDAPGRRSHPRRGSRQAPGLRRPRAGGEPGPGQARAAAVGAAPGPAGHPARGTRPGGQGHRWPRSR